MPEVANRKSKLAATVRLIVMSAVVLGGLGYVFRHSLLPGDHAPEAAGEPPVPAGITVTVLEARPQPIARRIVAGGTLTAREEVLVLPQVSGAQVLQVLAEVGDQVVAGQTLAVLDGQKLGFLLAQKAADVTRAKAAVAQANAARTEAAGAAEDAKVMLDRALALRDREAISAQALEEKQTTAATAAARLDAHAHALDAANADLLRVVAEHDELLWQQDQLAVRAPVAGTVIERTIKVGQTSGGDGTPLFRIIKNGEVELEVVVVETALMVLRAGGPVSVTIPGGDAVGGRIRLVAPSVDPATRMGKVWVSLTGVTPQPGIFARAVFTTDEREAILLPHSAVQVGATGAIVQVVSGNGVSIRSVKLGLTTLDGIEIASGLQPGELVVANAIGFLREGTEVTAIVAPGPVAEGGL
jgi:HlyD family secretion protein